MDFASYAKIAAGMKHKVPAKMPLNQMDLVSFGCASFTILKIPNARASVVEAQSKVPVPSTTILTHGLTKSIAKLKALAGSSNDFVDIFARNPIIPKPASVRKIKHTAPKTPLLNVVRFFDIQTRCHSAKFSNSDVAQAIARLATAATESEVTPITGFELEIEIWPLTKGTVIATKTRHRSP